MDDDTTTVPCGVCGKRFTVAGKRLFCSTICRQAAWRAKRKAPAEPIVKKADVVYECTECECRYLGEQRCPDCNVFCRRIGPGGLCPCCGEPVSIDDLFDDDQLAPQTPPGSGKKL